MTKIAIVGSIHKDGLSVLTSQGYDVFEIVDTSIENLKIQLSNVDAVALRTAIINENVLKECPKIKIISRHGVGYNNVDLNYLNNNNQALAITGTSNAISVAEHVMTMFLCLTKNINASDKLVRSGGFKLQSSLPNFFEIYKKKILILGFGRIGQAVAKRCLGFDTEVLVYDPFVNDKDIKNKGCSKIDFDIGIKEADFITIHLPLSEKTRNLITKKEFSKMKKEVILVNTARGGIVNEIDLYYALKNNHIHAAGIDVFEIEPPSNNNKLFKLPNVLLTPHNSALTLECRKRMAIETAENILYYIGDRTKLNKNNIVNKEYLNL
ncbi:hydroxyacid dehydrogenase [Alphaproteobacteria bacterium]|nr:hydroxyacid dehydrogenase [Alphaproteobacteria bacterium]